MVFHWNHYESFMSLKAEFVQYHIFYVPPFWEIQRDNRTHMMITALAHTQEILKMVQFQPLEKLSHT